MASSRSNMLLLAAISGAATVALSTAPAFAAGQGAGGGATIEEFVCFRSTPNQAELGTGKVVTTPSGNVNVVCTGNPL